MHDASSGMLPEETALEWCQEWLAKVKDASRRVDTLSPGRLGMRGTRFASCADMRTALKWTGGVVLALLVGAGALHRLRTEHPARGRSPAP